MDLIKGVIETNGRRRATGTEQGQMWDRPSADYEKATGITCISRDYTIPSGENIKAIVDRIDFAQANAAIATAFADMASNLPNNPQPG